MFRRSREVDLETAKRLVWRAERRALQRADELRVQAEDLLKVASAQSVETEVRIRKEFEAEAAALREEMDVASRRATVAESELDLLRSRYAELEAVVGEESAASVPKSGTGSDDPDAVQPLQLVTTDPGAPQPTAPSFHQFRERMTDDTERLLAAAGAVAARLHSQAEIDLARARNEAVAVLATATREAEDLLNAAVAAIERDTAIANATLAQAQSDGEKAATARQAAEAAAAEILQAAEAEAEAIRRSAEQSLSVAIQDARRLREASQREAQRFLVEAERESSEILLSVRRQLAAEISDLCEATDRTRDSVEHYLEATTQYDAGPGTDRTHTDSRAEGLSGTGDPAAGHRQSIVLGPGVREAGGETQRVPGDRDPGPREPVGERPIGGA